MVFRFWFVVLGRWVLALVYVPSFRPHCCVLLISEKCHFVKTKGSECERERESGRVWLLAGEECIKSNKMTRVSDTCIQYIYVCIGKTPLVPVAKHTHTHTQAKRTCPMHQLLLGTALSVWFASQVDKFLKGISFKIKYGLCKWKQFTWTIDSVLS